LKIAPGFGQLRLLDRLGGGGAAGKVAARFLLGGAFGVLRGALVCAVIVAVMMAFSTKQPPGPVANSRLAPYVMGTARILVYAAPHEFREAFQRSSEKLRALWEDVTHKKAGEPETDQL